MAAEIARATPVESTQKCPLVTNGLDTAQELAVPTVLEKHEMFPAPFALSAEAKIAAMFVVANIPPEHTDEVAPYVPAPVES